MSTIKITTIGTGFLAMMLVWTFYNAYMPLVLSEYIDSSALRGGIMGLDNLIAVFLIPVIGTWSDRINGRHGQRLPFLAVGMPLAALFFILIPIVSETSLWVLLCVDVLFLLAMTIFRAPVISLMPDETPPAKRSSANGLINLMGGIGAMGALFGLSRLYTVDTTFPFLIAAGVMLLSFALLWKTINRKPPYANAQEEHEETKPLSALLDGLKHLPKKSLRGPFLILLAIFCYFIGYSGIEAQFTTYAVGHLGMDAGAAGTTLGFFSLSFVLFALPAGLLGNRFGKVRMMLLGLGFLAVFFIAMPFLTSVTAVRIILFIAGFGWALVNVQAYPLVADLGGKENIGYFTGLYYFFSMASSLVAPFIAGLFMDFLSLQALFYVAVASFLVAFVLLRQGTRTNKEWAA
ncbi:MFS transporter [Aureibacillus halotolerans]|uniref:Na+/melibiose symporter-like transporter n=1 Tax=Aureibacillus halotolerans TaxID=1508390 RepID=A0A4R6UDK4_9BACI|nr:MFS transporter [Aureibacillus halotolerans]TDQ42875.1 Na+/melibiose symporter-like transporter [Aureibacillus halotolerans]